MQPGAPRSSGPLDPADTRKRKRPTSTAQQPPEVRVAIPSSAPVPATPSPSVVRVVSPAAHDDPNMFQLYWSPNLKRTLMAVYRFSCRHGCTHPTPMNGIPQKLLSCFNHRGWASTDDEFKTMWQVAEHSAWTSPSSVAFDIPSTLVSCDIPAYSMKVYVIGRIRMSPSHDPPGSVAYVVYQVTTRRALRSLVLHVNYEYLKHNKTVDFSVFGPGWRPTHALRPRLHNAKSQLFEPCHCLRVTSQCQKSSSQAGMYVSRCRKQCCGGII
jgi:hypothetical protein